MSQTNKHPQDHQCLDETDRLPTPKKLREHNVSWRNGLQQIQQRAAINFNKRNNRNGNIIDKWSYQQTL